MNVVANTILEQLGGNVFLALTGTKSMTFGANHLTFKIGTNAKHISHVRVTLDADDTYKMESFKMGRKITAKSFDPIKAESGLYFDMLQDTFEEMTELYVTARRRA